MRMVPPLYRRKGVAAYETRVLYFLRARWLQRIALAPRVRVRVRVPRVATHFLPSVI